MARGMFAHLVPSSLGHDWSLTIYKARSSQRTLMIMLIIALVGMSGGGKSSVARAGVLPMLTKPGVIESVTHWRRAVFRPTDVRGDLFAGLASVLAVRI